MMQFKDFTWSRVITHHTITNLNIFHGFNRTISHQYVGSFSKAFTRARAAVQVHYYGFFHGSFLHYRDSGLMSGLPTIGSFVTESQGRLSTG